VPQILLIGIALAVVWIGVAHGLAPIDRIQRTVTARAARDFSPIALADVPGELRPLLTSINTLMARLESALTMQSRFIADAAHQLKTPVAGLQAQLELAVREQDADVMRQSISRSFAGLERLDRLVSQLLSLARNEPQAASAVRLEPLDVNALALEATKRWVPEALKKKIDLGFEGAEHAIVIRGESGRLHELLDNLLDNAVRYSRNGGRVTVRASADPYPIVTVSDDGPSIPPEERKRIFERFHRLLGTPHDGSGLGLSIALEIARIHGAEIRLSDDLDGVGNTFSIHFPITN
jgi:two-component system sensor histidine kinase TctE